METLNDFIQAGLFLLVYFIIFITFKKGGIK